MQGEEIFVRWRGKKDIEYDKEYQTKVLKSKWKKFNEKKALLYTDPEYRKRQKEYFRAYYEKNKERILIKNRRWAREHRIYPGKSSVEIGKIQADKARKRLGEEEFIAIRRRGGRSMVQNKGINFIKENMAKARAAIKEKYGENYYKVIASLPRKHRHGGEYTRRRKFGWAKQYYDTYGSSMKMAQLSNTSVI